MEKPTRMECDHAVAVAEVMEALGEEAKISLEVRSVLGRMVLFKMLQGENLHRVQRVLRAAGRPRTFRYEA